jgi:phosphinothricin acetyltransferase
MTRISGSNSVITDTAASAIESTEAAGIWTIQSGIFKENLASLALHERV